MAIINNGTEKVLDFQEHGIPSDDDRLLVVKTDPDGKPIEAKDYTIKEYKDFLDGFFEEKKTAAAQSAQEALKSASDAGKAADEAERDRVDVENMKDEVILNAASVAASEALAKKWATQMAEPVEGELFSAKQYAVWGKAEYDSIVAKYNEIIADLDTKQTEIEEVIEEATNLGLQQLVNNANAIKQEMIQLKADVIAMKNSVDVSKTDVSSKLTEVNSKYTQMQELLSQMQVVAAQTATPTILVDGVLYTVSTTVSMGRIIKSYEKVVTE